MSHVYSSVFFLIIGAVAAFLLHKATARRERKKMISEIKRRDNLLYMANCIAEVLFNTAGGENVENVIMESMEIMGKSVNADRVHITQNETVDGSLYFTCKYSWVGDSEKTGKAIRPGMRFPYSVDPDLEINLPQGKCINGPLKNLPPATRKFFAALGIKSILVIPLFVQGRFWGRVGFSDCRRERFFGSDEVSILRSASLLMAIELNRSAQAADIRETNNRIRLLTNATPLGFNLWDRNLRNFETNDTAVKLFGMKDHKEYLERFFELSPDYQPDGNSSRKKTVALVAEAFEKGYCQFEWMHQKLNGTPIPAEITLIRVPYGDDYAVTGYMRDLREYKKMIAEIEHRDLLLQIVNQAADILLRSEPNDFSNTLRQCMGIMTRAINADRMYLCKNHTENGKLSCIQLYEWPANIRPYHGPDLLTDSSYIDQTPQIKEALSRGECVRSLARNMPYADWEQLGAQGVLSVMIVPVFMQNEFWGFVGFDNCHSEQMFTENEESIMLSGSLLIANALMRNEYLISIQETSAKLEVALGDAKDANSAKSSFLAQMSHEIRTPLNAVIGLSDLAIGEGNLSRETESKLEQINSAGSTILSIVNDILDISKIESGKFELYPVRYDTPSFVNDVVTLNIVRILEKPVTFKLYVDENLPGALFGDDLRVKQVFNNLLSNAFKYTNAGTVEWRISFAQDGSDVWLVSSIRDTGIGIKPEDVKKLFSDYNQVDRNTNRRTDGTGLGLAITKRLVGMMDGSITVESEYGKGSSFSVRLRQTLESGAPIGKKVAENLMSMRYTLNKRTKQTKLARVDLSYANVLVVDDITTNLDVAKGMMRPYGMKIDCALSGPQAIEMIRAESPRYSAIFMDHMMPGMDGIETTRIIREEIDSDYARNIPIIALTANAIVGNEEMFLGHGFQDFISKPVDVMKLDALLRRWVRDKSHENGILGDMDEVLLPDTAAAGKITISGVDTENALERFGGDAEVYISVLRSYAANTRPLLSKLREYIASGNLEDYSIAAHGFKGASYGIAATEAGKAADALEAAAKAGNMDEVKSAHDNFEKTAVELLDNIDKTLGEIDAGAEKSGAALAEQNGFTAPGAVILIVDDNETNLKLAEGLLKPLRMSIDTAANGKEALRMIRRKQYHLILMDHMMPVMDGIEATEKLRRTEGEYYQNVPVIALTADSALTAEEHLLQSGMNDFIAKPVERKQLFEKIRIWLPDGLIREQAAKDILPKAAAREDLPVIEGINSEEGVRYSGTRELFISLLGDFYKMIDLKAVKIEKCLADGLTRDVTIEVHALKNTARMIGASELSVEFSRLERYGNEGDVEALERETPAVLEHYRSYKPILKPFGEIAEHEKEAASNQELIDLLNKLKSAMDGFDLDGADEALARLERLRIPEECRTHMETLRAYVADVAMEEVIKLTGVMIGIIGKLT